jgi:hypothetical protein
VSVKRLAERRDVVIVDIEDTMARRFVDRREPVEVRLRRPESECAARARATPVTGAS